MRSFADIMFREMKAMRLDAINYNQFDSFEDATEGIIEQFENDIKAYALKDQQLDDKIQQNYQLTGTYESKEQLQLVDEQIECERQTKYIESYLDALSEMKTVYLFKSLEQTIKYLITTVHPDINTRALFRWDVTKELLQSKGIEVAKIDGYREWMELMKVNNCIKHESAINDAVLQFPEFANKVYFDHEGLTSFYHRIRSKAINFCRQIKEEMKDYWYKFPEDRLTSLSEEYFERMDKDSLTNFILKLTKKLDDYNK